MMKYFLIILQCCLLTAIPAYAQVFDQLTVENGLSQSSVMAIAQDKTGMIWLGTRYGINRYDAKNIVAYTKSNSSGSLSENYILSLYCDSKGTLWAGTLHGLNRYNSVKDNFEQLPVALKENRQNINCIAENAKDQLLVGVCSSVWVSNNKIDKAFSLLYRFDGEVKCMLPSKNGTLYIGTTKGLFTVKHGAKPQKSTLTLLKEGYITGLSESRNSNIWVGTNGDGLIKLNPATNQTEQFTHSENQVTSLVNNNVRKVLADKNGKIWVGTQEGLSVLHQESGKNFINYQHDKTNRNSLSQNSVHSLYQDRDGTVWVGTFFGGASRMSRYQTPFVVNRYGLSNLANNAISSMIEDEHQNLWIGTEGDGLTFVNRSAGQNIIYKSNRTDSGTISSNLVKVIFKDHDNNIWIGTHAGGLNVLDKQDGRFKRLFYSPKDPNSINSEITSINEDHEGSLWLGTQQGVMVFQRNGTKLTPHIAKQKQVKLFDGSMVLYIYKDSRNRMWFGTESALYWLDNGSLHKAPSPAGDNVFRINSITEDRRGNMWVGSYYNGLHCYSGQGKLLHSFNITNGLSDNNIVAVCEDDLHHLWISTGNGLCKYIPAEKRFLRFYANDGLAGNVFNNNSFCKSANGELLFGGYSGITSFMPEAVAQNKSIPAVVFSSLKIFGNTVTPSDTTGLLQKNIMDTRSLTFAAGQNAFSIGLSVLNFIRPEKNRYAYQLTGIDKGWKYTNDPLFHFNNLAPGNYVLIAKGSNNDGFWSKPVSLNIKVLPPFWKTWTAYIIYMLIAAGILFFIIRYFFLREWVKKSEELTKYKLNFFTDISHEIRTHLALIIGPADYLLQSAGTLGSEANQLKTIKNNSESLLQLVNELMDFRRAEVGFLKLHISENNFVAFVKDIYTSFQNLSVEHNIAAEFISSEGRIDLWFDPYQLEKVIYNLLSNAFKFTPYGGSVKLFIEQTPDGIILKVENNGAGIPENEISSVFNNFYQVHNHVSGALKGYGIGLALAKSIIELHGGTIMASSKRSHTAGERLTAFTINLKKGAEHLHNVVIENSTQQHPEAVDVSYSEACVDTNNVLTELASDTERPTVLLVEDNPGIRQLIIHTIQHRFNITACDNGLDGWQQAIAHIPDIIVSDVMMPGIDGIELCKRLKSDGRTSHIPVVMLTAKTTVENQISGLQSGADIYMPKPFNVEVLALGIKNLLASRKRVWEYFERTTKVTAHQGDLFAPAAAPLHPLDIAFLTKISGMVTNNMMKPDFNIAELSSVIGMSQPVLSKKIKAITGLSTNDYVKSIRFKKAAELIAEKRYTVYEVAYMVGYDDSRYFSREFKKYFGKLPSTYA